MRLRVKSYDQKAMIHLCVDEFGRHRRVDLMVDGAFGDEDVTQQLVGKLVEVEGLQAYDEIASGVQIVTEGE